MSALALHMGCSVVHKLVRRRDVIMKATVKFVMIDPNERGEVAILWKRILKEKMQNIGNDCKEKQ